MKIRIIYSELFILYYFNMKTIGQNLLLSFMHIENSAYVFYNLHSNTWNKAPKIYISNIEMEDSPGVKSPLIPINPFMIANNTVTIGLILPGMES